MIKILHISDLHFYRDAQAFNMRKILLKEAEEAFSGLNEKLLIVTGDFHNFSSKDFNDAKRFLEKLFNAMKIEPSKDVFVVPGNHDAGNADMLRSAGIDPLDMECYIDRMKWYDERYLEKRLKAYTAYCDFVRDVGIYPDSDDKLLPVRSHVRQWRGKLNVLHLNTTLAYDGKHKPNQVTDITGASNDGIWEKLYCEELPTLAIGHNFFFDLKETTSKDSKKNVQMQSQLESIFANRNVSAYLCGDTHRVRISNIYRFISIQNRQSASGIRIPCIVCAKSIGDMRDNYSDFGYYLHEWDEKNNTVMARFQRWDRSDPEKTIHDKRWDRDYPMRYIQKCSYQMKLDSDFAEYIDREFESYKVKNIEVGTPQLLSMALRYPGNSALNILNHFKGNEKPYGDVILRALDGIDKKYEEEGRIYQEKHYSDYQKRLTSRINNSDDLLEYEDWDCISPRLFCLFILECTKGTTVEMIKSLIGDRYDMIIDYIKRNRTPSIPVCNSLESNWSMTE